MRTHQRQSALAPRLSVYIYADVVIGFLENLSFNIKKKTVLILDNASVHKSRSIRERIPFGERRGPFITYLPPNSPHLNIAETVWRKLKKEWLDPQDYVEKDKLFYAANRWLAAMGKQTGIKFSHFNKNLF